MEHGVWKLNQISGIKGRFLRDESVSNRQVSAWIVSLLLFFRRGCRKFRPVGTESETGNQPFLVIVHRPVLVARGILELDAKRNEC